MLKDYIFLVDGITGEYTKQGIFTKKSLPKTKKFDKNKKQVIFISSDADIPRSKLREFVKNTEIKITTKVDKADTIIINSPEDYVKTHTLSTSGGRIYKKETILNYLKSHNLFQNLQDVLETYEYPTVLCKYHFSNNQSKILEEGNYTYHALKVCSNTEEYLNSLETKNFCLAEDILKDISDSSPEITESQYRQLHKMLCSDNDNGTLAMEIMANCNYVKSLKYLCALFINNASSMYNSTIKRHVNFKSLLTFLGLRPSYMSMDIHDAISLLHTHKVLDTEALDFFRDEFLKYTYCTHHKIRGYAIIPLELSFETEEILEVLGKPYTFKVIHDDRES